MLILKKIGKDYQASNDLVKDLKKNIKVPYDSKKKKTRPNWKTISNSIKLYKKLTEELKKENKGLTKKEILKLGTKRDRFSRRKKWHTGVFCCSW